MDNSSTNSWTDLTYQADEDVLTYNVSDDALEVASESQSLLGAKPLAGSLSSSCFWCHCIGYWR